MKVVLVTPRFPPDIGGVERYVARLAQALRARGEHEVTVVTSHPGRGERHREVEGIEVIGLGTLATVSNTPIHPAWPIRLRRVLRRLAPDVVNAHAPVPGLADLTAYVSPAPVVLTYHAGSLVKGGHRADPLLRAYERHVLPRVFDRCAALVAVSPVALSQATGRAELVPPGVDVELFTPPGAGAVREPRILYVGRVERTSRWKGLWVLVDAMAELRETLPDVRLSIVGSGDDVAPLQKRAADLGIADLIDWHGEVRHEDLPDHYRRAGVAVLPSLTESESFGMTLIEAMAAGCPVVGSRVGGIPFVVRDGVDGLLVPPGEPSALAGALASVLTDPGRCATLGEAGRRAAVDRWSWPRQEDAMIGLLTDVAEGRRTR
jgi:glycosyltransferase involved in cell wall biosynthesis